MAALNAGKPVMVVEHHQALMARAGSISALVPGAGHNCGRIVVAGTPASLVTGRSTLAGVHLAAYAGA